MHLIIKIISYLWLSIRVSQRWQRSLLERTTVGRQTRQVGQELDLTNAI